ncbi:MAG TPA: sulfotransferase [Steroidobacteraceae bacterium]|nr:sulfotransferase [Steroidobacteraceae bacterium]
MDSPSQPFRLVFVIGFPRSGTSWFANLINAHPDTLYRHEILGRQFHAFGAGLFSKLKFDHGLSDEDHAAVVNVLKRADVETEKPPFFRKRFRRYATPGVQRLLWLAGKGSALIAPVYARVFTPRAGSEPIFVVKETRSSVNLDSIIKGARASKLIVLVRHPYGVVASHLRGSRAGLMDGLGAEGRRTWFTFNASAAYIEETGLTEADVAAMSEAEFVALCWRVQNEDYLKIHAGHADSRLVVYEAFLRDRKQNTRDLLTALGLEPDAQVMRFVEESSGARLNGSGAAALTASEYFSVYRSGDFRPDEWRDELASESLSRIDRHTRPLVERLGLDQWLERP